MKLDMKGMDLKIIQHRSIEGKIKTLTIKICGPCKCRGSQLPLVAGGYNRIAVL